MAIDHRSLSRVYENKRATYKRSQERETERKRDQDQGKGRYIDQLQFTTRPVDELQWSSILTKQTVQSILFHAAE